MTLTITLPAPANRSTLGGGSQTVDDYHSFACNLIAQISILKRSEALEISPKDLLPD